MSDYVGKLGRSIETSVRTYNEFVGSLERRVLVTARKFDQLDEAKVIPSPQVVEAQTRRLDQPEFAALEQAGVDRPEIDFEQIGLPVVDDAEEAG
jgi:DNA recombination protein RmuC